MILVYPYFLGLFLLLGFALVLMKHESTNKEVITPAIREKLAVANQSIVQKSRKWLLLGALSCIILSLCRPIIVVNPKEEIKSEQMGYLVISLDVSKSMLAEDIYPNRLTFSKVAIETMLNHLSSLKIALNAFSKDGFLVAPFSEDKATLQFLLKHLNQNSMTSEGSSILSTLASAKKLYEPFPLGIKDILIVSDGADGEEIEESIKMAKKENFRVHLYLVGTIKGTIIKDAQGEILKDAHGNLVITKRADQLEKLALETGGVYVATSGDSSDIAWLCAQIVQKSEKNEVSKQSYDNAKELFYYPLIVALALLFLALNSLHVKRILVSSFFLLGVQNLHSGILDFWTIKEAEQSYENKAYEQATHYFSQIVDEKKSDASKYNLANSLYQEKKYDKALELYKEIKSKEPALEHKKLHNIGNTLVNMNQINEAIKAYEEALKISEDADTQYNLELLKQKKEEEKKEKDETKEEKPKDDQKGEKDTQDKQEKQEPKDESQEKSKESKSENQKESESPKKMSEQEAKKWEKMLNDTPPQTKPVQIFKGEKMENKNAITW
ncbi:MAG: tetratricopeptide repeat protein [Campylobacteraceae bacterium]|nr:tetratricopeptide repeat protein [Campylobacteraceae bacterium]